MKKIPFLIFSVFIFYFCAIDPLDVHACSCAELPSVEDEFERSQAVFSGKVLKVSEKRSSKGYSPKLVLFEVTNTWKGVKQSQIYITTGQDDGDCGISFIEGIEYLVYANESDMYGEMALVTGICDRTAKVASAQEDLKILGKGSPPTEEVDLTKKQESSHLYIWIAAILVIAIVFISVFKIMRKNK
ncbi:hypothetical protein KHA94_20110 [Bacillus sp. FJAT-49705]|uniref:Tissue inhibitor of metalloproteinase n=1 Tax=Cytobacillus citreus TaxID=2833586 RepID=A0ABS5NYJ8_9BACI|nr:hypothetical protein [Cytobacillus citreus]MBS4192464.1 hypothetical protein [Cytobacillus citreus]